MGDKVANKKKAKKENPFAKKLADKAEKKAKKC